MKILLYFSFCVSSAYGVLDSPLILGYHEASGRCWALLGVVGALFSTCIIMYCAVFCLSLCGFCTLLLCFLFALGFLVWRLGLAAADLCRAVLFWVSRVFFVSSVCIAKLSDIFFIRLIAIQVFSCFHICLVASVFLFIVIDIILCRIDNRSIERASHFAAARFL